MSLRQHVRVDDETHDELRVLALVTRKSYPTLVAEGLAALLSSDPKLKAKVDAVRKAAA